MGVLNVPVSSRNIFDCPVLLYFRRVQVSQADSIIKSPLNFARYVGVCPQSVDPPVLGGVVRPGAGRHAKKMPALNRKPLRRALLVFFANFVHKASVSPKNTAV